MPGSTHLKKFLPQILTWSLVLIATLTAVLLYQRWVSKPWTRDAQVRADIIKVTPQVNGNVIKVNVTDNQLVSKGELLFQIDPETYELAVANAQVALNQAREVVASLEASVKASDAAVEQSVVKTLSAKRGIAVAEAGVKSSKAAVESAKAGVIAAQEMINLRQAELDNAKSEASRADRLAQKRAGSIESAEMTAATELAKKAQVASAKAGLTQANSTLLQAESSLSEAKINLALAKDSLAEAEAAEVSARASLEQAKATLGTAGEKNVRIRKAQVNLDTAELELNRTRIISPCNGYISNLSVSKGSYAVAGQALVAVVDQSSFRIHAYFQETKLSKIKAGDEAVVTLMSHSSRPIRGLVENTGNAVNPPNISPTEGQAGEVPQIQPTFDWVRLPQRVPVRIRITDVPEGIQLISGTTASVAIRPGKTE